MYSNDKNKIMHGEMYTKFPPSHCARRKLVFESSIQYFVCASGTVLGDEIAPIYIDGIGPEIWCEHFCGRQWQFQLIPFEPMKCDDQNS
jgi:hypothetical protein